MALRCAGLPDEAADHIERARVGLTRGFGWDSTDALAARLSQALNLLAMDRYREAKAAAEEVLMVYEERVRRLASALAHLSAGHRHRPVSR